MKPQPCIRFTALALTIALTAWTLRVSAGDDKSGPDPTGTWKLALSPKPQSGFEPTLKLKREGDKLTGTLSQLQGGRTNDVALEDVKLKGAQLSFATHQAARLYEKGVLQPADKSPVTESKFQGAISGDTIKGKVEREFAGTNRTLEWEARRVQK